MPAARRGGDDHLAAGDRRHRRQPLEPGAVGPPGRVIVEVDDEARRTGTRLPPGPSEKGADRRLAQHRRQGQDEAEPVAMAEPDLQRADRTQRRPGDDPAVAVGQRAVAPLDQAQHGIGDELAVDGAEALARALPRHRHEVAAAPAIVRGDAGDEHRRQAAGGGGRVEPGLEPPAAVPALAPRDLGGERRIEPGDARIPVEQVLPVMRDQQRVAPRCAAVIAGRQIDEDPLGHPQLRRRQQEALEAVRRVRAAGSGGCRPQQHAQRHRCRRHRRRRAHPAAAAASSRRCSSTPCERKPRVKGRLT